MLYKEHYKKLSYYHVMDHVNTKQIISFFDKKEEHMKENYCNWFSFLVWDGSIFVSFSFFSNSSKYHICLEFNFSSYLSHHKIF